MESPKEMYIKIETHYLQYYVSAGVQSGDTTHGKQVKLTKKTEGGGVAKEGQIQRKSSEHTEVGAIATP